MSPTWKAWLTGAANAALSGVTGGGISAGLGIGWHKALIVAGGCAFVSFSKWFSQHPLPGAAE